VGYRGRVADQERARELRAQAWTLAEIAEEVGAAKGAVSVWVRDVEFDEDARLARELDRKARGMAIARQRGPSVLQRRKQAQIDAAWVEGAWTIGLLEEREFLVAGVMLYAGEGSKTDGKVTLANSDPRMIDFFCRWLRRFFDIDESRLFVRLYLHEGLDLAAANRFWAELTRIPLDQFYAPYRAVPDASIRRSKHPMGCPAVGYTCARTHRRIMGLMDALLSSEAIPG
jgi:hypothetical protein